jgi:hypothetical protein
MGKTHSKPLAARHGRGTAWARYAMCESAFRICLSHLIYTGRPCLIHICHAGPMPCSDHAVLLRIKWERHILNPYRHGMAGERHGRGMLCVNRPLLSLDQAARNLFGKIISIGTECYLERELLCQP